MTDPVEFLKRLQERKKLNSETGEKLSQIGSFLSFYNIQKGQDKVTTRYLYFLYLNHCKKNQDVLQLSKPRFFVKLGKYLNRTRWGRQRYYLIDESKIRISEALNFQARLYEKTNIYF